MFIDCFKVLDHEFYMQNPHFLLNKPNKPNFHKNINIFFSKYPYIHVANTLFIDDMPCKIMFNRPYSAIFLELFWQPSKSRPLFVKDKPNFHKNLNICFSKYPYTRIGNMYVDHMSCKIMFNESYNAIFLEFFYSLSGHHHYLLGIVLPWNIFIPLDMVFPHLYITILLIGLDVLIVMILNNLKCCLWNAVVATNPHFVTIQNWNWNKSYLLITHLDILVWIFDIFPFEKIY